MRRNIALDCTLSVTIWVQMLKANMYFHVFYRSCVKYIWHTHHDIWIGVYQFQYEAQDGFLKLCYKYIPNNFMFNIDQLLAMDNVSIKVA